MRDVPRNPQYRIHGRVTACGFRYCPIGVAAITAHANLRVTTMPQTAHADADFVRDTSPQALEIFYEIQRRRPPEQKLSDAFDLSQGLFDLAMAGVRTRHPEADEREVFLRTVATRLPRELMVRAYGWDPLDHAE